MFAFFFIYDIISFTSVFFLRLIRAGKKEMLPSLPPDLTLIAGCSSGLGTTFLAFFESPPSVRPSFPCSLRGHLGAAKCFSSGPGIVGWPLPLPPTGDCLLKMPLLLSEYGRWLRDSC